MKKAPTSRTKEPSRSSLRELPEIDFDRYRIRRNGYAKRIAREGIDVAHDGPSRSSLRAMPEARFAGAEPRRNPYATRIAAGGITLQVGKGRPTRAAEVGPTLPRSVRLPPAVWRELERRARLEGVAVHALVRRAVLELLGGAASV